MSVEGIDPAAAEYAANTSNRATADALSQEDFLEVLVAQMAQQDPFKPADSTAYFENIMQMSTYESTLAMDDNIQKVYSMQQQIFTQSLVGETVEVVDDDGNYETGLVDSAYIMDGNVIVEVNGREFASSNVTRILKTETGTETTTE